MTCYKPLLAYKSSDTGKIRFNPPSKHKLHVSNHFDYVHIPCGQCIGCKLNRSRQWAVRCVHEAQMHEENCFITLTFNDMVLEQRNQSSINVKDFQNFMKKLRNSTHKKIRFFHCGEYGDKNRRPHYHAILFGYDFPDKILFKNGTNKLYISDKLRSLWPYGFSTIGDVSFDSAAYVARYCTKKITGDDADAHYTTEDGEVLTPEYCTMSRKPGIGYSFYKKFKSDIYPHDYCEIDGKKILPPRYYDEKLKGEDPDNPSQEYLDLKKKRLEQMESPIDYLNDPRLQRLNDVEQVKKYKQQKLIRQLEVDN